MAEALQGSTGLITWVCLDEIVVIDSVLLQLVTVIRSQSRAVDWWVRVSDLGGVSRHDVNYNEGAQEQNGNYDKSESLSLDVVPVGEVSVLPDDIRGL